ncbi:MAG: C/D box methylation guide ribonucleoprotein complex aNOP56 subunit [Methanobacteriota archaeon]
MISLSTNVLGVFALKEGRLIKHFTFSDDPKEIAKEFSKTREGICDLEEKIIKELAESGINELFVDNPKRFYNLDLDVSFTPDKNPADVYSIAEEIGFDTKNIQGLIQSVNRELVRTQLQSPERDQLVVQAVKSLDELEESVNILSERLREWYSLHFPELNYIVPKNEIYAQIVSEAGDRINIKGLKIGLDTGYMEKIVAASLDSFGFEFKKEDAVGIKSIAQSIVSLHDARTQTEKYLGNLMSDIAPNITHLIGPQLGARLIAKAGNLNRLARLPAGTIQVLGAEDAFFLFLKTGKNPPKHGLIFTHPDIRSANKKVRGRLSRTLAAKIAIAARSDAFHGEFIADKLLEKFKERVNSQKRAS